MLKRKSSQQSKQQLHSHLPNKLKKFKQTLSTRRLLMATVFCDRRGWWNSFKKVNNIRRKTKELCRVIQSKRCGMLTSGVVFHDSAHPHTAACTRELLVHFNWELFDHPPYNHDLAFSNYHLFTYLKN
jgi:hypothetical protein